MTEYTEHEVEIWLVNYVNKNEDTFHQLSIDLRDLERTLFDIKVKKEIILTPMREYIENWLRQTLIKITKEDQVDMVGTGHETATKDNTKGTSASK